MDATAIKAIAELAINANTNNREGDLTHIGPVLLHDGKVISLEKFMPLRARFRGRYSTKVIDEFAAYVSGQTIPDQCFVDPDTLSAVAFFNLGSTGSPGHADWTAVLKANYTAAFCAASSISGTHCTQKAITQFIEDWADCLAVGTATGATGPIADGLNAVRNLTIHAKLDATHTDKDFGASRSKLEDIEAKAAGGLPTHFVMRCSPFLGAKEREIAMRLSIHPDPDKPTLSLRIVGHERLTESITEEFRDLLASKLSPSTALRIGSFSP